MEIAQKPLVNSSLLEVRSVSKKFCRHLQRSFRYGMYDLARQSLGLSRRGELLRKNEFWALRDVSFDVERGESLGIVGANGAGKTTLLKIVGGLIKPDAGTVIVRGRVVPLFARGAGFSKYLTAKENIYLNLMLLGLRREEIDERVPAILDFATVEAFRIDSPLKTFSSGMMARLAFACAVQSHVDLLLVDEALAVGDMGFRAKCYRKLTEMRRAGTSVIMVAHSVGAINNHTDRAIYLKDGRVCLAADTSTVTTQYEADQLYNPYLTELDATPDGRLVFLGVDGQPTQTVRTGQNIGLRLVLPVELGPTDLKIEFEEVPRGLGVVLDKTFHLNETASGPVEIQFPEFGLVGGVYRVRLQATASGRELSANTALRVLSPSELSQNVFYQPVRWTLTPESV